MDKTVKIRAYSGDTKAEAPQASAAGGKNLEFALLEAQLQEEKSKSLEHLKTIVQLRESLKQEQAKVAELSRKPAGADPEELARKTAQLEEERQKWLELAKANDQLKESLKQEQARAAEAAKRAADLDAKAKELLAEGGNELSRVKAQLEEEKNKSLAQAKTIEQLNLRLQQEEANLAQMSTTLTELEHRAREFTTLENRVKELGEALGKIAVIAAAGKAS